MTVRHAVAEQYEDRWVVNWFISKEVAIGYAVKVACGSGSDVDVHTIEMGLCGCGPPMILDHELLECQNEAGPDCGCNCHELEAMVDDTRQAIVLH